MAATNPTLATLTTLLGALQLQVYSPESIATIPVASTLIIGPTEVVLVDTQMQTNNAAALIDLIAATGRTLKMVFNSHSSPDYYFGNEVIQAAYPDVPIYATAQTIRDIESTREVKMARWGPLLQPYAPTNLVIPQELPDNWFTVDGYRVDIVGPVAAKTYCWIESESTVLGGISVYGTDMHAWLGDDQTPELRAEWQQTLTSIEDLCPQRVIPSHFIPGASGYTIQTVRFTAQYLSDVERLLPLTNNSQELIAAMLELYPQMNAVEILEMSAMILKGEMQWP